MIVWRVAPFEGLALGCDSPHGGESTKRQAILRKSTKSVKLKANGADIAADPTLTDAWASFPGSAYGKPFAFSVRGTRLAPDV
jgi:hypothetical protein